MWIKLVKFNLSLYLKIGSFIPSYFYQPSSSEWEEQLGDCVELDDKTSWFCEVNMLLPFPNWQVSKFHAKKCLSWVQNSKNTKIYSRITFEY